MIDNIQPNKLLFLDIETCGSYATIEELEDKNIILFNLFMSFTVFDSFISFYIYLIPIHILFV